MGVIIQPCGLGDRVVRQHYVDTVHQTVDTDRAASFLTPSDAAALRESLGDRDLRLWGVKPGVQNDRRFGRVTAGDIGFFYSNKLLFGSFEVLHVFSARQPELARELWGEVAGETREHMYALGPVTPRAVPLLKVQRTLNYGSNWIPQGFAVHDGEVAERLVRLRDSKWPARTELFARYGLDAEASVATTVGKSDGRRHLLKSVAREHVLAAIAEYDSVGEVAFLETYGFGQPSRYWLVRDGKRYASKAILGAAVGFLPGEEPLLSSEFSGGIAETIRILKALEFETSSTLEQLTVGVRHEDRRVISALYGGNPQSGITRFPDGYPSLFSHHNGPYEDGRPSTEHEFAYRGQGATGTQSLDSGGNKLLEQARVSRLACRFWHQDAEGSFLFFSWVAIVGRTWVPTVLSDETTAHQISWILQPVSGPDVETWPERAQAATDPQLADSEPDDEEPPTSPYTYADLSDQSERDPSKPRRSKRRGVRNPYVRSERARRAVRMRATACENPACTGMPPDVSGTDGGPLLDVDHVRALSDGGADHPSNMLAVCPNCHRAKTLGSKAREWERSFAEIATRLHAEAYEA